MKKSFLLWVLITVGVLATALPVQAQTIAQLREELQKTFLLLQTFDNSCVVLVNGLLGEITLKVLEGRKLITIGMGNTSPTALRDLISDARNDIEILLDSYVGVAGSTDGFCRRLLEDGDGDPTNDDENSGTIFGDLNFVNASVAASAEIESRKRVKIGGILNGIVLFNLTEIQRTDGRLDEIASALRNGADGVDDILGTLEEGIDNCPNFVSGDRKVAPAQKLVPQLGQQGPCDPDDLRQIKILLGQAYVKLNAAISFVRRLVKNKATAFKGLKEVENLLRSAGFGKFHNSEPAVLTQTQMQMQIYDLHGGRLVYTGGQSELSQIGLANGLYMAVVTVRARDGGLVRREVHKIAVIR